MCYRSSFKYLAIKNATRDVAEGLKLKTKLGVEDLWAENLFNSSISRSIGNRA